MQQEIAQAKIDQILKDLDEDLKFFRREMCEINTSRWQQGSPPQPRQLQLSKLNHLVVIAAMRIMTWEPTLETTKKESNV